MNATSRRQFLAEVGRGMIVAGMGTALATDYGFAPAAWADEADAKRLDFGLQLEPLAAMLQETPPDKLLPLLVEKLKAGLELKQLTAAAALANARTFGGEHYGGFHSFMAIPPAYQMARELPTERQALPLLKVLYRNASFIQSVGGRASEVLKPVEPQLINAETRPAELQAAINRGDKDTAERLLAGIAKSSIEEALQAALLGVEDNHDVHTVVLPWRAYATLEFTGKEHATTLLRQSVRKCAVQAVPRNEAGAKDLARRRAIVPKLMEQHKLLTAKTENSRPADDAWLEKLANTIISSTEEEAAGAVAAALAEGFDPSHIGEAVSLASNALLLRQVEVAPGNYGRRTHGDSMGVHASDTSNAWRNMIRVVNAQHRAAGLMLAAANVAQSARWASTQEKSLLMDEPFPHVVQRAAVISNNPETLVKELHAAIRDNNQLAACAIVEKYGKEGHAPRAIFDALLTYAISEDGRLHGEKFYRTVSEEFATTRPSLRWRHLIGLARVSASEYGFDAQDKRSGRAPGYDEACKLLGIA